jgi:thiol:disulfide interchange protein DsbD
VVATPCSAPFLGTAVGFAFASPWPLIVAIFLAIGVGLALPFVLVTLVPAWARFIPRGGSWMLHLRAGLGFALLGTVVWLLWVMGRSAGSGAQTALLAYLVVVSAGVWIFGALQRAERPGVARRLAVALAAVSAGALPVAEARPVSERARAGGTLARRSRRRRQALGRSSRVRYFTADWCLTCKANERLVLHSERVQAELARRRFAVLKADWTHRDEAIRAELARFGKAGVPLYLWFPDAPTRRVLPECHGRPVPRCTRAGAPAKEDPTISRAAI